VSLPRLFTAACLVAVWFPLAAQDFDDVKVERAADKLLFAEGPAWAHEGWLIFCDVPSNRMMKFVPGEGTQVYRENSNGAEGNAIDSQGRLYTCEARARRVTRTDKKGKIDVIAEKFEGKRLNAPNDITVRHDFQTYFTDPAFGSQMEGRELNFFGVYHISPKGDLEVIAKPKGRPNGIALAPGGKILYVTNSDEKKVYAYDLDKNGVASNERVALSGIEGIPDGIRTDEKGNLYIAAKAVLIYTPEGKLIRQIPLSEKPSNLAFGDSDLQSLYVTARTSVYRLRLPVKGW
jgi:sugar lactone lactonase YvrE